MCAWQRPLLVSNMPSCGALQITGPGLEGSCMATVLSVSEQTGLASVQLEPPSDPDFQPARYSDTVQVPLRRLTPPRNEVSMVERLFL